MSAAEGAEGRGRAAQPAAAPRSAVYGYFVVGVLMVASTFSFIDRMILSLLIDPIRKDQGLTDTEVSLLAGFAFAICYVLCAFPFGRWVDTRGRRNAIVLGMSLWSLATAACGLVSGYWKLFVARMGVGVGEASLNPAAYSMIPDYFPPHRRGLAMSIYACGASIGGGFALLLGGVLVQQALQSQPVLPLFGAIAPWKLVFIAVGLPGLVMALIVWLTVREPPRVVHATQGDATPKLSEVIGYVGQHWKVFLPIFIGFSGFAVNGYAFQVWGPSYFMRLHGLTPAQVGLLFGAGYGVGGTAGIILGGMWSDWMVRRGHVEAPIRIGLWSAWMQAPFFLVAYLSRDTPLAVGLFAVAMGVASLMGGLQATMVQSLTPNRMRGMLAALYGATVNVMGLGVAPTVTAILSDRVFGGDAGLGKALAVTCAASLGVCSILLIAGLPGARRRARAIAGL